MSALTYSSRLVLALAGFCLLASALLILDRQLPDAGLWILLAVTITAGFGHGALDAQLLTRRFTPRSSALLWGGGYLLVVMLLGWALSHALSFALFFIAGYVGLAFWGRLCAVGSTAAMDQYAHAIRRRGCSGHASGAAVFKFHGRHVADGVARQTSFVSGRGAPRSG